MIEQIRHVLASHSPVTLDPVHGRRDQAAVLMPLRLHPDMPHVILTERASSLSSHGGEVAFPGGKADPEDRSLQATALRENHEELGILPEHVEVLGELRPFISKHGLLVTPFVGLVEQQLPLDPNPDEIETVFEVPLDWFVSAEASRIDDLTRHGERHLVPAFDYQGYDIWGLTAMILKEFLAVTDMRHMGL